MIVTWGHKEIFTLGMFAYWQANTTQSLQIIESCANTLHQCVSTVMPGVLTHTHLDLTFSCGCVESISSDKANLWPTEYLDVFWLATKEASCHSQWHVHNGSNTPCCSRPSGRPEPFPGRPARFVHVHVTVDDTWHHYTVAHIQHLSAQTGSGRRWLTCITATIFGIFGPI